MAELDENPNVSSPNLSNPDVSNPDVSNPDVSNLNVSTEKSGKRRKSSAIPRGQAQGHAMRRRSSHKTPPKEYGVLRFIQSVEEYFSEGMKEYFREIEESKAKVDSEKESLIRAAKLRKEAEEAREKGILGDALERQLIKLNLITRCTQTEWNWCKMALRWRHARIIESTYHKSYHTQIVVRADVDVGSSKAGSTDSTHLLEKHDIHSPTHTKLKIKKKKSHFKLGARDKCIDTSDLVYNPYNPDLLYTPVDTVAKKTLSIRCSQQIKSWMSVAHSTVRQRKQGDDLSQSQASEILLTCPSVAGAEDAVAGSEDAPTSVTLVQTLVPQKTASQKSTVGSQKPTVRSSNHSQRTHSRTGTQSRSATGTPQSSRPNTPPQQPNTPPQHTNTPPQQHRGRDDSEDSELRSEISASTKQDEATT